jgi:hypothetical protein
MIPVAGVLMILTVLGTVLIVSYSGYGRYSETNGAVFAFVVGTVVFGLSIAATLLRFFPKRLAGVLLNMGYFIAPFYLPAFIGIMLLCTRTVTVNACHPYGDHQFSPFWMSLAQPWILVGCGVLGSVCYFALIKKWYAKEE